MRAHDGHGLTRLERGRPLTDDEIDCYIADRQTPLRHGTADVGDEIAEQLHDRLRAAERQARRCGETTVLRAAHRVGEERPVERIYICDRADRHVGQHVSAHYLDGSQLVWSDVPEGAV